MVTTAAMPEVLSSSRRAGALTLLGCFLAPVRICGEPGQAHGPSDAHRRESGPGRQAGARCVTVGGADTPGRPVSILRGVGGSLRRDFRPRSAIYRADRIGVADCYLPGVQPATWAFYADPAWFDIRRWVA